MKNQLLPMKKSIPHEKWPLGRFPATNARGLRCGSINLSIGFLGAQLERLIPQMEAEPFKSLDNNLIIGCSFSLGKKIKELVISGDGRLELENILKVVQSLCSLPVRH